MSHVRVASTGAVGEAGKCSEGDEAESGAQCGRAETLAEEGGGDGGSMEWFSKQGVQC
jgi:hypothetical protein